MLLPVDPLFPLTIQSVDAGTMIPKGWTNKISARAKAQVEDMLEEETNLPNVMLDLAETAGNQYLFTSGLTFYFWNVATQAGVRVLNQTDKAKLYAQIEEDIRKVETERLPYVEP